MHELINEMSQLAKSPSPEKKQSKTPTTTKNLNRDLIFLDDVQDDIKQENPTDTSLENSAKKDMNIEQIIMQNQQRKCLKPPTVVTFSA